MQRMDSLKSLIHNQQIKLKHLSARLFREESLVISQTTPYQVIGEFGQTRIRYYAASTKRYKEPLVLLHRLPSTWPFTIFIRIAL